MRKLIFLGILFLLPGFAGAFEIYYPEPFDFHYPDETTHENISDRVRLQATLGEYESGTFVVFSSTAAANVTLSANNLSSSEGILLPRENINVGIVTFMSRAGNEAYLNNIWIGGINQEVRERLPVVPVCIVKNDTEFEEAKANAVSYITLTHHDNVKTSFSAGQSKQFWITVHVPAELDLPQFRNLFSGNLTLSVDGVTSEVPLEVEVMNLRLDNPEDHNKYIGVMRAWDVGLDFRETVMEDIRAHGCNALRAPLTNLQDYEYVRGYGFDLPITTRYNLTAEQVQQIWGMGILPLMYGRDEPGKPPDPESTIQEHIDRTNQIHYVGGLAGTSGSYNVLSDIVFNRGVTQDWWLMGFSTRSWGNNRWINDLEETRQYLAALRQNPNNKIVTNFQGHYEGTMNGHYPLLTRLLYGFWFYNSNLDMAIHWGYATSSQRTNPYTNTRAFMVAFPSVIYDENSHFLRREMIHSYTWDSYREGIDDLRYALTVNRMIDEMTDTTRKAVLRSQFTEVLSRFREIDVGNEHQIRIDAYNGYAGTRQAREILIEIMAEINGLSPQLSDPTVSEQAVSDETVAEPTVSEEAVSDQTVAEPTVSEPTASEPTASEETVYLSNSPIDLLVRGSNYRARVFITVWDETGRPVTKAVVQGQWSLNGKYINEVSGSSNKEGIARLISNRFSGRPGDELTLIITDVVKHGYSYDFVLNIADDISVDLP